MLGSRVLFGVISCGPAPQFLGMRIDQIRRREQYGEECGSCAPWFIRFFHIFDYSGVIRNYA